MKRSYITMSLCLAACLFGTAELASAEEKVNGVLVGVDARENSSYGYLGLTRHFGKHPLDDGFIGRLVGFGGKYEYDSNGVAGGRVQADYTALEALFGYQKVFPAFTLRAYLGAEYEGHDLSPDNSFDDNRGDHFGAKLRGDLETDFAARNYGNLIATYGTARDRYWVRGRVGRDFSGYVVGPEIILTGDRLANEERIGAFLNFRTLLPAMLSISAGQARTEKNRSGYTPYLTMEFSSTF